MSNTRYGRAHMMRFDDEERDDLARLVMAAVQDLSFALNAGGGTQEQLRRLRRLRSLLERLHAS